MEFISYEKPNNIWRYVQTIVFFPIWLFGTDPYMIDGAIFILVHLISFFIIFRARNNLLKTGSVSVLVLQYIHFYHEYFIPVFFAPFSFRVIHTIENVIDTKSILDIFGMVFAIIGLFLCCISIFFSSVFIDPIHFVSKSNLDWYDGKHKLRLYVFRFLCILSSFISRELTNIAVFYVYIGIYLLLCIFFIWDRIDAVHVSGQYLNFAPICIVPFAMVFDRYLKDQFLLQTVLVILLDIFLYLAIKYYRVFMSRHAMKLFRAFSRDDTASVAIEIPRIIPGAFVTVLRLMESAKPDPIVFEKFLAMHKRQGHPRTSCILEVVRICSVFPDRRHKMLEELNHLETNSLYNHFIIYLFKKMLKSLTTEISDKHIQRVEAEHRSFLVHQHLFWVARRDRRYFEAFTQSCLTAYYYIQARYLIEGLMKQYPLDRTIPRHYSEFLISACGDYDNHARVLTYSQHASADPILMPMMTYNPRVYSYLSTGSASQSYTDTGATKTDPSSSTVNRPTNIVAAYIKESNRYIPFLGYLLFLVPVAYIIFFQWDAWVRRENIMDFAVVISNHVLEALQNVLRMGRLIFVEVPMEDYLSACNYTTLQECQEAFSGIIPAAEDFINKIPQLRFLGYSPRDSLELISFNFNFTDSDICKFIDGLPRKYLERTAIVFSTIEECVNHILKDVTSMNTQMRQVYISDWYYYAPVILLVVMIIFTLMVLIIQVNVIMHNETIAIDYLSSIKRLTAFLLEKGEEAWDLLVKYLPEVPPALQETETHITSDDWSSHESSKDAMLQHSRKKKSNVSNKDSFLNSQPRRKKMQLSNKLSSSLFDIKSPPKEKDPIIPEEDNDFLLEMASGNTVDLTQKPTPPRVSKFLMDLHGSASDDADSTPDVEDDEEEDDAFDPVGMTISRCQKEDSKCKAVTLIFFPTIAFLVATAALVFPISMNFLEDRGKLNNLNHVSSQIASTTDLFRYMYSPYRMRSVNREELINVNKTLSTGSDEVTQYYLQRRCYELTTESRECISMAELVTKVVESPIEELDFTNTILPITLDFVRVVMSEILYDQTLDFINQRRPNAVSFLVACLLFEIVYLVFGVRASECIRYAFNSLFHFPIELLRKAPEIAVEKTEKRYPDSVIVVSSIARTKEIYAISDNTQKILEKSPTELICKNLDSVFPTVTGPQTGAELREYTMPDGKTKRLFRCQTQLTGQILKTVMIESKNIMLTSGRESNAQKLSQFMPISIARQFTDSNIHRVDIDGYFIFCECDLSISQQMMDKGFLKVGSVANNFGSVMMLKSEANYLVFATKTNEVLVAYLFVRDMMNELKTNFITKYIIGRAKGYAEVVVQYEPFLNLNLPECENSFKLLAFMPALSVAFGESMDHDGLPLPIRNIENIGNVRIASFEEYSAILKAHY